MNINSYPLDREKIVIVFGRPPDVITAIETIARREERVKTKTGSKGSRRIG